MVNYWYFIRDFGHMSPKSLVYKVKVGQSQRDMIKFGLVREYCRDCGFYFHKVSTQSDTAISKVEKSLFPGCRFYTHPLRRADVSISDLYKMIIDDSFDAYEANFKVSKGTFRFLSIIDPDFLARQNRTEKKSVLPIPIRKNLKLGNAADMSLFLVSSCTIILLFLFAAYLEGKFVYHL